jgi:hypothetical protein
LGLGWLGEPFLAEMIKPFFALANITSPVLTDTVFLKSVARIDMCALQGILC